MTDSLRDQLLGLGFKPAPRKPADKPAHDGRKPGRQDPRKAKRPAGAKTRPAREAGRSREDIDLAKAYAIRAQKEKNERIEAERLKQEAARERREARARLAKVLEGKPLNAPDADIARHFDYGGKIKRVYVTADQLRALNAGELGVVQQDGRYLLVAAAVLAEAEATFAQAIALKVDPAAPQGDDPDADPAEQVPDDLVW